MEAQQPAEGPFRTLKVCICWPQAGWSAGTRSRSGNLVPALCRFQEELYGTCAPALEKISGVLYKHRRIATDVSSLLLSSTRHLGCGSVTCLYPA